jgi:hypothetical protein
MPIVMEMKMKERKIEINVWSRSECKVGTKKQRDHKRHHTSQPRLVV